MKYIGDGIYMLSDGTEFYANCGIIGVSPKGLNEDNDWYINGGYDQSIYGSRKWTKKQRKEVSDYMIAVWKEWSEQGQS